MKIIIFIGILILSAFCLPDDDVVMAPVLGIADIGNGQRDNLFWIPGHQYFGQENSLCFCGS